MAEVVAGTGDGEDRGGARTAVVMNAGAAIYVAGISETLEEGVAAAAAAIDDGSALEALEGLRKATHT